MNSGNRWIISHPHSGRTRASPRRLGIALPVSLRVSGGSLSRELADVLGASPRFREHENGFPLEAGDDGAICLRTRSGAILSCYTAPAGTAGEASQALSHPGLRARFRHQPGATVDSARLQCHSRQQRPAHGKTPRNYSTDSTTVKTADRPARGHRRARGLRPPQILLPAIPAIRQEFAVSGDTAQLTLSLSMAAIALGTLTWGPLSDKYGRRPIIMLGLLIALLGSLLCFYADTIESLIAGRFVQAFGRCSGAGARPGHRPRRV